MLITYAGSKSLSVTDTFEGMVAMVLHSEALKEFEPLKITFPGTGKVLYFDRNLFEAFSRGELSYSDLIKQTEIEELYRNWLEIETTESVIEPGALWKRIGNFLTLVDDDMFVERHVAEEGFEVVK
jgi:hypothetical protein